MYYNYKIGKTTADYEIGSKVAHRSSGAADQKHWVKVEVYYIEMHYKPVNTICSIK